MIVISVNPTLVNVLTDLVLLLFVIIWQQVLKIATVDHVRAALMKGTRLVSLEPLGSVDHIQSGVSKYKALVGSGVLKGSERKSFGWKVTRGFGIFIIGCVLVLLHVVIDYGLDFQLDPRKLTDIEASYRMVELGVSNSYNEQLALFSQLFYDDTAWMEEHCTDQEGDECRNDLRDMRGFSNDVLRESMSFGRTLYGSASLAQADMIDGMEIEYEAIDRRTRQPREGCTLQTFSGEADFAGLQLHPEGCIVGPTVVRSFTIDMRARVRTRRSFRSVKPEYAAAAAQYGITTYESFKDEFQLPSLYSLDVTEPHSGSRLRPALRATHGLATVSVDSSVTYPNDEAGRPVDAGQQVRLIQLTRKMGEVQDKDLAWGLWTTEFDFNADATDADCVKNNNGQHDFSRMRLQDRGRTCGRFDVRRLTERCLGADMMVLGEDKYISGQMTKGGLLLFDSRQDGGDNCLAAAMGKYGSLFDPAVPPSHRAVMMGTAFEVICARRDDDKVVCAGGPERVRWTGDAWVEETDAQPDADQGIFALAVETTWIGVEVHGGNAADVSAVFDSMTLPLEQEPAFLRWFSSDETHRMRMPGGDLDWAMTNTLSAMSPHVRETNRTLLTANTAEVSVLQNAYIGGLLTVMGTVLAAAIISVIATVMNTIAYRRGNIHSVRIPHSITAWMSVVLRQLDPSYETTNILLRPPCADGYPSTISSESFGPPVVGTVGADDAGA